MTTGYFSVDQVGAISMTGVLEPESSFAFTHAASRLDSATGKSIIDDRRGYPAERFQMVMASHAERSVPNMMLQNQDFTTGFGAPFVVAEIREGFAGAKGMLLPFFAIAQNHILPFNVPPNPTGNSITIPWMGYTANFFPRRSRRFLSCSETWSANEVITSVDNQDGTETLTFGGNAVRSQLFYKPSRILRFCYYVRFDSDVLEIRWKNRSYCEARVSVIEVPDEIP